MAGPHRTPNYLHEGCTARVVWAAHILSYLKDNQNHEELHEAENEVECGSNTDESSDCEADYETEKKVVLSGPRNSVRQKFLDCIAQLLSPCKGWDGVTTAAIREGEDGVEVDVARNDGFHSDEDCLDSEITGYCKMLEVYLADSTGAGIGTNTTAASSTEFELKVIDYTSRRIDHWIEMIQKTLGIVQNCPDWNSQRWLGQEAAFKAWTTMTDLIRQFDADNETVRQFFANTFGTQAGLKLWSKLNFIARPLVDCRLLRSIAAREQQLRYCKISLVLSKPKTTLETIDVIGIFEAWEQLGLGPTPEPVFRRLHSFSQMFETACAESFSLHAEMQLVMHYEERCAPRPTLSYFGCSKKTCLLCETFLGAFPSSIATRGRHGVCYPAWAVPGSNSGAVEFAIERLEKSLLARIRGILNDLMHPRQKSHAANVMQSGMVSNFSHLTLEEWKQREQDVQRFKDKQTIQRNDLLIIEGITPNTKPKYRPLDNFEPKDCCVMCNTSPGIQCVQCRSTYYCSRDCKKSDFPSHSLLCKQFAIQPDRPSPEHKRAIFFPVESDKPCLIWVPCTRQYDEEDGIGWTWIDPYPYLGTDKPLKGTMRIEHNPVRCRNLGSGLARFAPCQEGYCVSLIHRDAYLKDGSTTNRSISASVMASCTSTIPHEYRGPMIALQEIRHGHYADITLADFRHLMDYLTSYRKTHVRESVPDLLHRAPTTFRGVKICCHGEEKVHGSEPFVSVEVTRANQSSLGSGSISPISVCLGMPLRLWKDPDTEFRHNPPGWEGGTMAYSNPNVVFLMMETNSSKDEWGWAPMYWNSKIGNVWAVREDGQDLAVKDVAMMCNFARRKLQCMFEEVMELGSSSVNRQRVLGFITWDNMITHWEETCGH
ncbi:uncharacterized protein N7443_002809 [Penicillium atrosanguineum]|uniref:uncharacterized protein n=1 Tax=Penicillium atrosanguineum TaxID=1132637 RepID=UPI00238DF244|nr:uncharacterized protein N7443_002809 [Penicillium atrosanguineum]KAJ5310348.1 hypothetical protein N7443_002809 [Penicillium atrosanguineum]